MNSLQHIATSIEEYTGDTGIKCYADLESMQEKFDYLSEYGIPNSKRHLNCSEVILIYNDIFMQLEESIDSSDRFYALESLNPFEIDEQCS